jgi:CheY-like chemotaxis protein
MDFNMKDRSKKILVAEGSSAPRTLITESLRAQGFSNVQAVPSLKEAIATLEVEPVSWIFTSVFVDKDENLLQLLKISCMVPELRDLRVSVFVEPTEMDLLPEAFELGLLTYHPKNFTKDALSTEFAQLMVELEESAFSSLMLAARYLRKYLSQANQFEELLAFERQLLRILPGDIQQFLNTAMPLAKTGKLEEAKQVLAQILKLDPTQQKAISALGAQFFPGESLDALDVATNILGIKSAIIVDHDSIVQRDVKQALEEMGVENIRIFDDGGSALDYLQENPNPDLIFQEWKIPKVTGPLFLQKAREKNGKSSPFIVCSSLIDKADVPFLREMGVAQVVQKPLQRGELIKGIAWTIQQDRRPTDKIALERKIRQALAQRKFEEAEAALSLYLADTAINAGAKQLVRAELAYAKGEYEKARDLCVEAMKTGGESILVLNLLGKTLLQLRVLDTALKCFERAQKLAPQNIERLCQMAEIHAELNHAEEADAILEKVDDMDKAGDKADESRAKIALAKGDPNSAKAIMSSLDSIDTVISYMNNRAIAMARCGMVGEGIDQYRKTIEAIPDNQPEMKSIVLYNLALAHLRDDNADLAKAALLDPVHNESKRMTARVLKLLARMSQAQSRGEPLVIAKLDVSQPAATAAETGSEIIRTISTHASAGDQLLMAVENRAGDRSCYLVYKAPARTPEGTRLLASELIFKPRKSIEKGESLPA